MVDPTASASGCASRVLPGDVFGLDVSPRPHGSSSAAMAPEPTAVPELASTMPVVISSAFTGVYRVVDVAGELPVRCGGRPVPWWVTGAQIKPSGSRLPTRTRGVVQARTRPTLRLAALRTAERLIPAGVHARPPGVGAVYTHRRDG
jgi:hypothetical protein